MSNAENQLRTNNGTCLDTRIRIIENRIMVMGYDRRVLIMEIANRKLITIMLDEFVDIIDTHLFPQSEELEEVIV